MKGSITTAIRGANPDSDNAKLYLAHIEEQFQGSSKAHATALITKMVTLKYSGSNGVREHILRMNDMASQLKGLDMEISEEREWKMSELISMCVQEEERLKSEQPDNAHVVIAGPSKGKEKGKKFGKGATVHITNSLQEFLSVKKLNKGDRNVLVGNREKAQVETVRTFRLVLESGFNLDLVDTVYVPSMTRNLISVSRLDAYGYSFKFKNKGFSLFLYSRVIGSGLLEGNLYKLLLNASFTESLKIMNVNDVVAKTCDDILLASNDMHMLHETKNFLSKNFDMKDLGEASYVMGIEIHRDRSRAILGLSQRAYIDKVLKRFNMHNCAPTIVPVVKGDKFSLLQCPRNQLEQDEMERIPYASAVGSLMYAQVCTRPDIAYVVGMLGRYQINPGMGHWKAAKKVMRYL
ncbi:hypothetical protein RJ640_001307 [Escallonia rubra]|uniref:Retrovirus-related Pol polyprotein from transposon TNT 1-94 n=1 Tax=Escallonia rubra TaxID=112253 RepID=A0AA88U794_9ASTE|nr:hypothetical protein RJ640_001307 [Escallonia rubra]